MAYEQLGLVPPTFMDEVPHHLDDLQRMQAEEEGRLLNNIANGKLGKLSFGEIYSPRTTAPPAAARSDTDLRKRSSLPQAQHLNTLSVSLVLEHHLIGAFPALGTPKRSGTPTERR